MLNQHNRIRVLAVAAGIAGAAALAQEPAQPFLKHSFEENESGWTVMGVGGKVARTTDAADAREGKSALAFDYQVEKGSMSVLMLPTPGGELTKARAIRFWIKTDQPAPVIVALQERDNQGRYLSMFSAPAGKWQEVVLSPADFYLSEDANDPKDPNDKLDLDAVESIGILDVSQMIVQGDPMLAEMLRVKAGAHRLLLDEFSVSAAPPTAGPAPAATEILLDQRNRPQLTWFGLGVLNLTSAQKEPIAAGSLQVEYRGVPGKPSAFVKRIPRGRLAGMDKVSFTGASVKPAKLMVQLEERGGGKYNVMIDLPGDKMPKEHSVRFSEFFEADDSKDANHKLDLGEVQQLVFMDLLAWIEMTERDNTLWIGDLKASK